MNASDTLLSKITRRFTYARRDIKAALGLEGNFFKNARGARILIYHGICLKDHTRFNPIFLTRDMFDEHCRLYKKYFNVLSLADFFSGKFSEEKFNVCITFDDGFANNFKYVLPSLEEYELPATFFITGIRKAGYDILWNDFLGIATKYGPAELSYNGKKYLKDRFGRYAEAGNGITLVDQLKNGGFEPKREMMDTLKSLFPTNANEEDYWMQMTEEEIKRLSSSSLVTIGSHGYYHNRMDKLPLNEAVGELKNSKDYLEGITGKSVRAMAFPYGNYSRDLVHAAKELGYSQLLAMDFHYETDYADPSLRERFTVNPFISANNQMHATITGHYE